MSPFSSVFSQILKLFPRLEFEKLVREQRAERHARGFTCWQQFVAMLFCQLGRAQSLREICQGLASVEGKLSHLGITAPARSTLAYANEHRPWKLYEALFHRLLARVEQSGPGRHKLRFRNRLLSLDSTAIDLCAELFDWAKYKQTKGAVKVHLLLDHQGFLPSYAVITDGKTADVTVGRQLSFPAGSVLVIDRGYNDYDWFDALTAEGVYFVTRMKRHCRYRVLESREIPQNRGVVRDETIVLESASKLAEPHLLRRVEVQRPGHDENLVFLTNHLEFGASTVADIYKQRWQVELFFKAIKQNLRIKTFVGTSANALKIQIWTALIAILVLRFLALVTRCELSLSTLVALLRFNLFSHRDLWRWLKEPFSTSPPGTPLTAQLPLPQFG